MFVITQIFESFRFAAKALRSNLLRTILSLLGVTVGIFAIIAVLTIVDSLEKNIKDSFNFLGTGVVYVDKWPYTADNNGEYKWWEFWRRPNPSYSEYKFFQANLKHADAIAILARKGNMVIRRNSNSIGQIMLVGGSENYDKIFEVDVSSGRYFTLDELEGGRNVVLLGAEVANALFPNGEDAVGKEVKIKNLKYIVIGVVERRRKFYRNSK
jgi:putative ABC transport system permease protein